MGTLKTGITSRTSPAGETKLYANIVMFSNISNEELIEYMATNSNISKSVAHAIVYATRSIIENYLLNGHTVVIPELGTFSLNAQTKSVDAASKVSADCIKGLKIRFTPAKSIRTSAKSTKFSQIVTPED